MSCAAGSIAEALHRLEGVAVADWPLAASTTYRVGGSAAVFATPRSLAQLRMVGKVAHDTGLPMLIVGRGSNMLVADAGFIGIAVTLGALCQTTEIDGTRVIAGSAVALPVLARRTAAVGLTGFEWAVGVPGSIGGAVRMNAGGHGSDMAACVLTAHILDLRSGLDRVWPADELGLRFRGYGLTDDHAVLNAELVLQPGDAAAGESMIGDIVRWRREHQPGGQNAGSVFVNPVPGELAAAELIDRLQLRGFRIGGASVSDKHANFVQADDDATAADVRAVIEHVRTRVAAATGILLRSEVRLVGFDSDSSGCADSSGFVGSPT
ncbi:MAG: UDP-N-acetylmuramate dehydrogenase [Ilumatobacteraceae bacterium]